MGQQLIAVTSCRRPITKSLNRTIRLERHSRNPGLGRETTVTQLSNGIPDAQFSRKPNMLNN
jgi:hypothetical protein